MKKGEHLKKIFYFKIKAYKKKLTIKVEKKISNFPLLIQFNFIKFTKIKKLETQKINLYVIHFQIYKN